MTRLITEWLAGIEAAIRDQEQELQNRTGLTYAALAAKVGGFSVSDIERAAQEIKVAVVPVTTGLGIIGSFAQSVAAVTGVMGFRSFVTEGVDVNGLSEAYEKGADIVYMADDDRFLAMNLNKRKMADNNRATALGYTAALEGALGSFVGKEILLLGCGVLGREFVKCLKKKGVRFAVWDIDSQRLEEMRKDEISILRSAAEIARYQYVIDATSQGNWLRQKMIHPQVWIAAPGIPLSLDQVAYVLHANQIIHDPLQIGTAAMLGLAL